MNRDVETTEQVQANFLYARGDEPFIRGAKLYKDDIFSTHVEMNRGALVSITGNSYFLYARGDEPQIARRAAENKKFSLRTWR